MLKYLSKEICTVGIFKSLPWRKLRKRRNIMDLKTLLGEELFGTVTTALVANPDVTILLDSKKEPTYLPKTRFGEVNGQRKLYKHQNNQLGKNLEAMKTSAKGNEK